MSILVTPATAGTGSRFPGTAAPPGRPWPMSVPPPEFLVPLLRQPVAVFGGGTSGLAARTLLERLGAAVEIFDERPAVGGALQFGAAEAARCRLVVVSPGFARTHAWLAAARAAGCTCLGELDLASLLWPGRTVAVTGTNGKTSLTEFLVHALVAAGEDASKAGNVGFPFSRLVAFRSDAGTESLAVCEVSSFQAEIMSHFRADAVLWTNFAEDHLERHADLQTYFDAKWNLVTRAPAGSVFFGTSVQRQAAAAGRELSPESAVASEDAASDPRLSGTVFASHPQLENFRLALAWWRHDGRSEADLYAAARTFKVGRHRLTRVAERRGVTYWNDSKATNFHATEAALGTLSGPVHLIVGGRAKGGSLAGFVRRLAPRVHHVWLIGETRNDLAALCAAQRVPHTLCASLAEAVQGAAGAARPGDHVLLSPGFASFDMFRGYADRGEQFERLVNNLGAPATFQ